MKREYLKPAMRVVVLNTKVQLLTASATTTVTTNSNNVGLNEKIEAGNGTARARSYNAWGDEDEEE
jgi:hypothetical protein